MQVSTILSATLLSWLVSMCYMAAAEEPNLVPRPQLHSDWELQTDPGRETAQKTIPYRWMVFKHRLSGDLLSFATVAIDDQANNELEFYTDTSLEIFPLGEAVWTSPTVGTIVNPLRVEVTNPRSRKFNVDAVLHVCFVAETPQHPNRMAHGQAWIHRHSVVFVQHTSTRPITSDLVEEVSRNYMKLHAQETDTRP